MVKLLTDPTNRRSPNKRLISTSDDEDGDGDDEDTPIAKRAKPHSNLTSTLTHSLLPTPNTEPDHNPISTQPSLSSDLSSNLTDEPDRKSADSSDDDDDQPIASSIHKLPLPQKRSIDESSAATTLTTNSDAPILPINKLPKIKKTSQAFKVKSEPDLLDSPSSDDDDKPLVSRNSSSSKPLTPKPVKRRASTKIKKEDPDVKPLPKIKKEEPDVKHSRKMKKEEDPDVKPLRQVKKEESDSDDSKPLIQTSKSKKPRLSSKKSKRADSNSEDEKLKDKEEQDEEEMYKWWEETKDDNSKKWTTLEHNGVLFPPDYEPLPSHVKMKYNGKPVDLPPESEEIAYFFGSMLNSDHVLKPTFCQNFFEDFCDILKTHPPRDGTKIKEFSKCDFGPIFEHVQYEREQKKNITKEEKKALAQQKAELEAKYRTCLLDGRKEKVGNFRVEPPSLFRGRGEHPKTGRVKKRVQAEEITINCSADSKYPEPPPGHEWQAIVHCDTASWLATWKENINGNTKYVFLAPGSSLKGQSDLKKFEKARALKEHIDRIRADYREQLTDKLMATRQRATAMYLIDRFALRAGNEKGDDEADTVGCCSLRFEHVTLAPPNTVTFDFLGKDSIRFYNTFQVDEAVFKNLQIFKKPPKTVGDLLFDRLTTGSLNKHLSDYMPGLTAKVFRTYNASVTFEKELAKNMEECERDPNASEYLRLLAYTKANRQVAVLCNHQRSVSKNHGISMEKALDKLRADKYKRRKIRHLLLHHPDLDKHTRKLCKDVESDLEDEWMDQYEEAEEKRSKEKVMKKYLEGDPKVCREELAKLEGLASQMKKERLSSWKNAQSEGKNKTVESLVNQLKKADDRIKRAKANLQDREEGKETSLGTSKTNYIDPRLSYAWLNKYKIDPKKIFAKTLQEKFTWAAGTEADWKF